MKDFIHPVISVSLYSETPFITRILKPKSLKLGIYTRKPHVLLKVQYDAVIEIYQEKQIIFRIENLEFSLVNSLLNGNCTFLIRDQISGFFRIYKVASFVELCWWFESFKRLKEEYLKANLSISPRKMSIASDIESFQAQTLSSLLNLQNLELKLQELKTCIKKTCKRL